VNSRLSFVRKIDHPFIHDNERRVAKREVEDLLWAMAMMGELEDYIKILKALHGKHKF
jgi:hypothetical protein